MIGWHFHSLHTFGDFFPSAGIRGLLGQLMDGVGQVLHSEAKPGSCFWESSLGSHDPDAHVEACSKDRASETGHSQSSVFWKSLRR